VEPPVIYSNIIITHKARLVNKKTVSFRSFFAKKVKALFEMHKKKSQKQSKSQKEFCKKKSLFFLVFSCLDRIAACAV